MTEIYDLNDCALSNKNGLYGGAAGSKDGILIDGERWIVKYPKSTTGMLNVDISYTTSPVCEYLGSHVYHILGYDTHETILGFRHDKLVVACKDFTDEKSALAEIRTVKNHANEMLSEKLGMEIDSTGDLHNVELNTLMIHIRNNPILSHISGVEERFFEQAVIDIYINNSDRNNGNWGILRHMDGSEDTLAPIYDNGGSFQDKISDVKAANILNNIELAKKYACGTQTVYSDTNGRTFSSIRFLELKTVYPKLSGAILKVVPLIKEKQQDIENLIDNLPVSIKDKKGKEYEICGENIKKLYDIGVKTPLLHIE